MAFKWLTAHFAVENMSNKAGRPQNQWEVKRVSVPSNLVPEVKKLIEQWKIDNESTNYNSDKERQSLLP